MASEIRWPGRDSLDEGLDVRTLELDPGGYAALDILSRADVMGHLSDWRAGSALGMRMQASVDDQFGARDDHGAARGPDVVPARWCGDGAVLADAPRCTAWPCSRRHRFFSTRLTNRTCACMAGERYLDEMFTLSERFHEFWGLSDGETAVMVFRVFQAPPPSVHSVRLPLSHVLSRDTETISPIEPVFRRKKMKSGENIGVYFLDGLCNNRSLVIKPHSGGRTARFSP